MSSWKYIAAQRNPKHRDRNIATLLFLKTVFVQGCHTREREPLWRRSWTWRRCSSASSSSSSSATSPGSSSTATSFSPARRSSGGQISDVRSFFVQSDRVQNFGWILHLVEYVCIRAFYLKAKLIDPDVTPPSTFSKKVIGWKSVNKPQPFSDYALLLCKSNLCYIFFL